jgi:hypothetical protein
VQHMYEQNHEQARVSNKKMSQYSQTLTAQELHTCNAVTAVGKCKLSLSLSRGEFTCLQPLTIGSSCGRENALADILYSQ